MKNCKQCGQRLKSEQVFCTNCGATVDHSEQSVNQRSSINPPTFFYTKRFKFLSIIAIILFVTLFTGYKIVDSKNHPTKIVQQFEKAIDEKNTGELAQLLNSGQDEMEVNETDARMLLDYFDDHPDIVANTTQTLRENAANFDKNKISINQGDGAFLSVVEANKKWLLFSQYALSFKPTYLKVSANQPKVSVMINNEKQEELTENNERTYGPFLPIEYEVVGSYKGPYGTVTTEEIIDSADYEQYKILVELDLTGNEVALRSNYDNALVFINGESTGKTVSELGSIGPIATDGTVKIYAELTDQGHQLKSDEFAVTEPGQSINLFIDDSPIYEAQAAQAAAEARIEQDKFEVESTVYEHYGNISSGYYSDAYDLFSLSRQSKIGFNGWEEGLMNNLSNDVKGVQLDSINGNKATASFEMVSRDMLDNGDVLVQTWGGKWHLVKENSIWKLSDPEISKLNERVE